ncbi:AAC(3) family N-acetyltransferase [Halobacillus salinarum]|uniref:Aminoglycoside N(3)-acetyltransferase n=1 Tax=Halobacillus salinarum TaxID=2932257 RepID=A0ABY4EJQ5_9BACI|nr:AAC(3) family N-acetyltransferase [Halobacillus salinarum]UOQ44710.1 AAC(3) family N-acetyltransferase [Halobacillus salinarum]
MSRELEIIAKTTHPNTVDTLSEELTNLGVHKGQVLLVHASMNALGWVSGGPQAVLEALMNVLTYEGTLVFQTHSPTLSDPKNWENPPVPKEWHEVIKATMPGYDPAKTPSTYLGILPELFRKWPQVQRSDHPAFSMAAWGNLADELTNEHPLPFSLGEQSPLGRAYAAEADILLLGTDYSANTSFHLAEYRSRKRKEITRGAPLNVEGKQKWVTYPDIEFQEDQFPEIGKAFETSHPVTVGNVGLAESRLFSMRDAVDFAVGWLNE